MKKDALKKPIYRKWWFWFIIIFIGLCIIIPDDSVSDSTLNTSVENKINDVSADSVKEDDDLTSDNTVEYDALQQLYLDIDPQMSYTEMLDLVKSTNLPYSEEKYNGSRKVQVAFTTGCTVQKYRDESGDYLEIIYDYPQNENSNNDILEKYTFSTCVYVPYDSTLDLISHASGTYFSYSNPGNYISDLGKTLELDKNMTKQEQLDYFFKNK